MEKGRKVLLGAQHSVFARLGDAELYHALRRDLDRFAGRGISSDAGGTVNEDELAETGQCELILGLLVSQLCNGFENLDGLFLGERVLFSDCGGDL